MQRTRSQARVAFRAGGLGLRFHNFQWWETETQSHPLGAQRQKCAPGGWFHRARHHHKCNNGKVL